MSSIAFVIFASSESSAPTATSLTLTCGFLLALFLMIAETRPTSKVSVTFFAGDSNAFVRTRRARHAVDTRLVTDVYHVSFTPFVASLTVVLFCHRARQICNLVIMSMDIVAK